MDFSVLLPKFKFYDDIVQVSDNHYMTGNEFGEMNIFTKENELLYAFVKDLKNEKEFSWKSSTYIPLNDEIDEKLFGHTDPLWDFIDKSNAILSSQEYDERVVMTLDLPNDVIDEIKTAAESRGISIDEFIEILLTELLNNSEIS